MNFACFAAALCHKEVVVLGFHTVTNDIIVQTAATLHGRMKTWQRAAKTRFMRPATNSKRSVSDELQRFDRLIDHASMCKKYQEGKTNGDKAARIILQSEA